MARPTRASVSITDAKGKTGEIALYLDSDASLGVQIAFLQDFVTKLDPITAGRIDGASLAIPVTVPGLKTAALPNSDRQEKYTLRFSDQFNVGRVQYSIPAINRAMVVRVVSSGYAVLDLLQDEPNDFLQLQTNPASGFHPADIFQSARGDVTNFVRYSRMAYRSK